MKVRSSFLKNYGSSLRLVAGVLLGALIGFFLKERVVVLKPLGDIFLNLLFTIVVPLVFFSISSSVAAMAGAGRLTKIIGWMMLIFILTGVVASALMIVGVKLYPPAEGVDIALSAAVPVERPALAQQLVRMFTVSDFFDLLSKKNMLALIIFSIFIGLAASSVKEKATAFREFLMAGNAVMTKMIGYVMLYAPIGLGAYFAYLVGVFGPELLGSYGRVVTLYYPLALLYFFVAFSLYVYLAGGKKGMKSFWANIMPPAVTALATGSSLATIPTNLEAARKINIPRDIREVVIPIGAAIHMEGSCLAAVVKIAFLFGLFHTPFAGVETVLTAIGIAILCGTVISGIPSGGLLGELLIVTFYGFPVEALPIISMIGTLVDPPATMINATGDNVSSMLIARILGGKKWQSKNTEE